MTCISQISFFPPVLSFGSTAWFSDEEKKNKAKIQFVLVGPFLRKAHTHYDGKLSYMPLLRRSL